MLKYPSNIVEKFLEKNYEIGLLKFVEELSRSSFVAGNNLILFKFFIFIRINEKQLW